MVLARTSRRLLACALVGALLCPSAAYGQSQGQQSQQSASKAGKKRGILLIVGGAGLAALGAAIIATYREGCTPGTWFSTGDGYRVYCDPALQFLRDDPHQKTYGGVIIGLGAAMAVVGVLGMRGPRASAGVTAPPAPDWRPGWLDAPGPLPFTLKDLRPGTGLLPLNAHAPARPTR